MRIITEMPGLQAPSSRRIKLVPEHREVREKWPKELKEAFAHIGPAAVWIGGARELISCTVHHEDGTVTRFGHNRLARPVKVGVTESWRDTVTQRLDQVPFWWQGLILRLWCVSDAHAARLAYAVTEHLKADAELNEPRRDFIDIGPDMDFDRLERDLIAMAKRMSIEVWTDDGLVVWLQETRARANELTRAAERRGRHLGPERVQ